MRTAEEDFLSLWERRTRSASEGIWSDVEARVREIDIERRRVLEARSGLCGITAPEIAPTERGGYSDQIHFFR